MSKRKIEATKRNAERKASTGSRKPPGYQSPSITKRLRWPLFGLLGLVLIGGLIFAATTVLGQKSKHGFGSLVAAGTCKQKNDKLETGTAFTTLKKALAGAKYKTDPPTSGANFQAAPLGVYTDPLPTFSQVATLKLGNVLAQYGDKVPSAQVDQLVLDAQNNRAYTVVAPYPQLGDRVVYTAWTKTLSCKGYQSAALRAAQDQWSGKNGTAPERLVVTEGGARQPGW